jgi:hypothetical protein
LNLMVCIVWHETRVGCSVTEVGQGAIGNNAGFGIRRIGGELCMIAFGDCEFVGLHPKMGRDDGNIGRIVVIGDWRGLDEWFNGLNKGSLICTRS